MYCEYELFSFCAMMPISVIGFMLWNYQYIIKSMTYGTDLGNVKFSRRSLEVATTQGQLSIPVMTLPSYDWNVGFFVGDTSTVRDGINDYAVVENHDRIDCNIVRNKLICEYLYPEQVNGTSLVRGYVGSMFDGECYVFTVDNGGAIDYLQHANKLMLHLEDL